MSVIRLKLPAPPEGYESEHEAQRNLAIEQADFDNQKKFENVDLNARQLVLYDPDGIPWELHVDRAGKLYTVSETGGILDVHFGAMVLAGEGTVT
jgi:hypothetical protein